MTHTKIISDQRGCVKIQVSLVTFNYNGVDRDGNRFRYDTSVYYIPKGKRKEIHDNSMATPAEILQAKTELWQMVKPV